MPPDRSDKLAGGIKEEDALCQSTGWPSVQASSEPFPFSSNPVSGVQRGNFVDQPRAFHLSRSIENKFLPVIFHHST